MLLLSIFSTYRSHLCLHEAARVAAEESELVPNLAVMFFVVLPIVELAVVVPTVVEIALVVPAGMDAESVPIAAVGIFVAVV